MQLSAVCAAATVSAQPADRQGEKKKKKACYFSLTPGQQDNTQN